MSTTSRNHNKCPHLENVIQLSLSELCKLKQGQPCSECDACGPNLWICLHKNCLHTGCSEQSNDHSTKHFKLKQPHCIHMNLSSQRIWCYLCEAEVFLSQRRSSLVSNDSSDASRYSEKIYDRANSSGVVGSGAAGESPETSGDEDDGDRRLMDGLVGLQNIANTCYMNAALQALSNSPPLTNYFLDCGDIIEATSDLSGNQRKPGLAKSYQRLIKDMWCRNKRSNGRFRLFELKNCVKMKRSPGYVVPRGILYGIRNVHPMFRGFQQHDTQEFLRCFMDQLHEELKEVTPPPPDILLKRRTTKSGGGGSCVDVDDEHSSCSSPSPSQSEAEYETCDSGVSEQSSLSDEVSISARRNHNYSRSPSPTTNNNQSQRNSLSSKQINQINNNNNNNNTTNTSSTSSSGGSSSQNKEQSAPKPPHRSIISDVFDGKLLSSVQCLTCDRISTREETFQDLSLPIPGKDHLAVLHQSQGISTNITQPPPTSGITCTDAVYQAGQDGWFWWLWNWFRSWFWGPAVSLHDCMAAFFSADELKGDNMYSCEKCNKLRNGIKYSRVLALPEMLCVHLKRFRHDLSYSSKISSPVHFPLTGLDMRPYLHKDCTSEISSYDLTAVICHHGTVGGGHYTSFAKHELTGKWFEFDDQLVTEVTPEVVQNCQAYVLFYRKSNPQMIMIRAEALELADINPPQASDIRFFVSRQWINRFNTFAEPGPIDNWALLCPHGGLPPCKAALVSRLAVPLPQPLWDYLYKKFGGGPACNHLFECDTCRRAAESLSRRQRAELEAFTQYNDEFQYQEMPTTIYAISMAWFRQWQLFARGVTTEDPGPINNTSIAALSDTMPIRSVRPGSDYAQINTTLWKFFHGIYGGGPEIILRGGPAEDIKVQKDKDIERMEVDQDNIIITTAPTSSSKDTDEMLVQSDIDPVTRSAITTSASAQSIHYKPTKNVSFEDENDIYTIDKGSSGYDSNGLKKDDDDTTNSSTASLCAIAAATVNNQSHPIPEFVIPSLKRTKQYGNNHSSNVTHGATVHADILGKKDKKYRGAMKSSGFFGPEGKYYTQSSYQTQSNNIPETNDITTEHNNEATPNPINNYSASNYPKPSPIQNPQVVPAAMNETSIPVSSSSNSSILSSTSSIKFIKEEVTPLLHHQTATTNKVMTNSDQISTGLTSQKSTMESLESTDQHDIAPIPNNHHHVNNKISKSSTTGGSRPSKTSHRKKFKSKNGRKISSQPMDFNGSDSG